MHIHQADHNVLTLEGSVCACARCRTHLVGAQVCTPAQLLYGAICGWHGSATLPAGVEATVLNGGAVLCHPEWPVPLVSRVMTRLLILDVSRPILRGQQVS